MKLILAMSLLLFSFTASAKGRCEVFRQEMQKVRFVAYVTDGVLKGWAVKGVEKAPTFVAAGVLESDVFFKIGRIELNSKENLRRAIQTMCEREVKLEVLRRGKVVSLPLW